jgi:hypothetical protein
MHPWEPLRGGHVRVSELMGKTWRLIIGSCITHHTVAMSECLECILLPSHHPLKHNARTRISNSHVSYHIAVEIGRATEQPRKHPSHLPNNVQRSPNPCPCPSPLHQSADPTHHKRKGLLLAGSRSVGQTDPCQCGLALSRASETSRRQTTRMQLAETPEARRDDRKSSSAKAVHLSEENTERSSAS